MHVGLKKSSHVEWSCASLYDHQQPELYTERAQRSQLWHLSGEQSTHCVLLEPSTAAEGSDLGQLCRHRYKHGTTASTQLELSFKSL